MVKIICRGTDVSDMSTGAVVMTTPRQRTRQEAKKTRNTACVAGCEGLYAPPTDAVSERGQLAVGAISGPVALKLQILEGSVEVAAVKPAVDLGLLADELELEGFVCSVL